MQTQTPDRHRVVIIGAGFGGMAAAQALMGRGVDITVIDQRNHHLFQPLLYQVATAGLSPADIAGPIRTILKRDRHTRVLLGAVEDIDREGKAVRMANGARIDFDSLIVATGASQSYFGADHWRPFAPGVKTLDDATRVRRTILLTMEEAETGRQQDLASRREFLTFVVVGGGPTGVEMAGAMAELTRHAAEMDFHYISSRCVRVMLVHSGDRLLPSFPPSLSRKAMESLVKLGVEVRLNARVTDITRFAVHVDEEEIPTTTVVWAAGVMASPAADWLKADADRQGRVRVGADLLAPGRDDIFVIGDTAAVTDASGMVAPGVAPAAKQQGQYAARAILARSRGQRPPPPFRYRDYGNLATIGRQRAVADFGWLRVSGFPAWLLWCLAHIYFLVGFRNRFVVGANWLWNYLTFERGARLITGGDGALGAP